jgi:lipoate-protein ligase A
VLLTAMLYIDNERTNPYWNLALEEYLLKNSTQEFFILWRNAPSIIIGRNQNTMSEISDEYVREHSISVVRRLTGGGAVFHDLGNLNYTFIVNDSEGSGFDFKIHTAPVLEVLHSLSVNAELSGRNDLTIGGRKFSGNSQCRHRGRLLHHGTLLFSSSISDISSALKVDASKFEGKGVQSVRSRVTNISEHLKAPLTLTEFKRLITAHIQNSHREFEIYNLSEQDIASVNQLEKKKYATWAWNYGASPAYDFTKRKHFPAGSMEIFMTVTEGLIRDIRLYGDFFGEYELSDIENALKGLPHEERSIRQRLSGFDLSGYFSGISTDDFISVIF